MFTLQMKKEYITQFLMIPSSNADYYTIWFSYETGTLHKYYRYADRLYVGEEIKGLDKIYKLTIINDMIFVGTKDYLFKMPRSMCQFKKNCRQCLEFEYNECVWDYNLNICNIKEYSKVDKNYRNIDECPKLPSVEQKNRNICQLNILKEKNRHILQIHDIIACGISKESVLFDEINHISYELHTNQSNNIDYIKINSMNYITGFFKVIRINLNISMNITCSIKFLSIKENYTSLCSKVFNASNSKYSDFKRNQSEESDISSIRVEPNNNKEEICISYNNNCYNVNYGILINSFQDNLKNCSFNFDETNNSNNYVHDVTKQISIEGKLNRFSLIVSFLGSFLFVSIFANLLLVIMNIKTKRKLKKIRTIKKSDRSFIKLLPQRIINTEL